jgi:hypothetical protein
VEGLAPCRGTGMNTKNWGQEPQGGDDGNKRC